MTSVESIAKEISSPFRVNAFTTRPDTATRYTGSSRLRTMPLSPDGSRYFSWFIVL